ncbi:hypothetical protein [Vibrio alginolyticus]|uniref:hypothetical protein n=1 Tax=Vibrio alginolyticus TaxID=663 RepID=UPI001BD49139|nr:hypothetical protein [Vibrio alginolyticus]MBS9828942.1 hypothetical protein [Vibrio alginolyticus]
MALILTFLEGDGVSYLRLKNGGVLVLFFNFNALKLGVHNQRRKKWADYLGAFCLPFTKPMTVLDHSTP